MTGHMKLQWPLNRFKNLQVLPLEVLSTVHLLILILGEGDPGQVYPAHLHMCTLYNRHYNKMFIFGYPFINIGATREGVGGGKKIFDFISRIFQKN